MKKMAKISFLSIFLLVSSSAFSASINKALMLSEHGLKEEAKKELINIIFSKSNASSKSQAYYTLGNIAFNERNISTALDSWRTLVKLYPKSKQAKLVKNKIQELAEIVGESAKESVENAIALSYLRHGDFWSKDKSNRFTIDSSWIPKIETAIKWYDKVISEFPKTSASRVAYQDKIRTLLGWEERGKYGSKYGVKKSPKEYIPVLLKTFSSFEKDHPKASTLQAFRYQIAQVYWSQKNWPETKKWLNTIIKKSGTSDSFYKDLAKRRLKKLEY